LDQMDKNIKGCVWGPEVWFEMAKLRKKQSWNQSSSIQITLSRWEENPMKANQQSRGKEWTVTSGFRLSMSWGVLFIMWDVKNKEVCLWSLCKVNYVEAS
jgi:hypothetical protein